MNFYPEIRDNSRYMEKSGKFPKQFVRKNSYICMILNWKFFN